MSRYIAALVVAFTLTTVACSGASAPTSPSRPATGAPVTFIVDKITPGQDGRLAVRAYNFADKTLATYLILLRYADASGKRLRVKVGTPFERDFDHWSISGGRYMCKPKQWCSFNINVEVPAGAAKAEVIATTVNAVAADGVHIEDADLWALPKPFEWPASIP